jgi:hypothetical protein
MLLHLLSGASAMTVAPKAAPEEIGAIITLTKGAQGVIVSPEDFLPLESQVFDVRETYPFLAGRESYVLSFKKKK